MKAFRFVPLLLLLPVSVYCASIRELCAAGDERAVTAWLDAGGSPDAPDQSTGMRPLHAAVSTGNFAVAQILLNRGAHIDARNTVTGESPLQYVVRLRQTQAAAFLLTNGASVGSRDATGYTVLHTAVEAGDAGILRQVLDAAVRATNGGIPLYTVLDDKRNWDGNTPLHLAAKRGSEQTIRLLVSYGASLNARNDADGNTPLHCAVATDSLRAVKALAGCGASLVVRNFKDQTPLQLAEALGYGEIAAYLKDAASGDGEER